MIRMDRESEIRIDKFLWAVRIYKTRSIASDECRKGRILVNNMPVKPSRIISGNEIVTIKKPPVAFTYKILEPIENRVSAKLVGKFLEDLTPEDEKIKLKLSHGPSGVYREKGTGRPTKKDRRLIDRYSEGFTDD